MFVKFALKFQVIAEKNAKQSYGIFLPNGLKLNNVKTGMYIY